MPGLLRIDHVQLAMPAGREDVAESFYGSVMGLIRVAKPPALEARGGCWFEKDGVVVHLGVMPDFQPATKAHPAFVVDDLDGFVEHLASFGVGFIPDDELEGVRRGYVTDPFGNRIELIDAATAPRR